MIVLLYNFFILCRCRNQAGEQDVQLLNDRKVVAQYQNNRKDVNPNKPVDQGWLQ